MSFRKYNNSKRSTIKVSLEPKTINVAGKEEYSDSEDESVEQNVELISSDKEEEVVKSSKKKVIKESKKKIKSKSKSSNRKKKVQKKQTPKYKTLYLNEDDAKPVKAAGVIFYKTIKGKLELLILKNNNDKYEDIGGKVDFDDETIFHAAGREVEEETNGMIKSDDVLDRLKNSVFVYVPRSKYIIYLVEANINETKLNKEDFGDKEEHDDIYRTIGWITKDVFMNQSTIKFKLNNRLKSKELFNNIREIENTAKFSKRII